MGEYTFKTEYHGYYSDSSNIRARLKTFNKDVQLRVDTNALKDIAIPLFYSPNIDAVLTNQKNETIFIANATIKLTNGRGKHCKILETTTSDSLGRFSFALENKNYIISSLYLNIFQTSYKNKNRASKKIRSYAHNKISYVKTP